MKRLISASILALLIHGLLFLSPLPRHHERVITPPKTPMVTMRLFRAAPPVAEETPVPEPEPEELVSETPELEPARASSLVKRQPSPHAPRPSRPMVRMPDYPAQKPKEKKSDAVKQTGRDKANVAVINEATPLYRTNPPPHYPLSAIRRGYSGTVMLHVLVNKKGEVKEVRIEHSSGYAILDKAAEEAVKSWGFEPGRQGDTPMDMWVNVPVVFNLESL